MLLAIKVNIRGFPAGSVEENLPADAGETGSVPGPGRPHTLQGKPLHHNYEVTCHER